MSERNNEFTPKMPWTIERQLEAYAQSPGHTERHKILRDTWNQNIRWFSSLLEYTIDSYPKYSQHNASHCRAVIHNIECLLGEEEIKRLSATDCYAILTAVYMHDVGMCISQKKKEQIITSDEFVDWLDREMLASNSNLSRHIQNIQRWLYSDEANGVSGKYKVSPQKVVRLEEAKEEENPAKRRAYYKKLYHDKLETANSTEQLIAEFQRKNHALDSSNWLKQELMKSSEISYGLSITGIPKRIHLAIADCAQLHGVSQMEDLMQQLMAMPQEDNGYAADIYHPRFLAVLLLIGDALDIDNNRFHPYARAMAGDDLGEPSETHYRKHQSIRSLQITPRKIFIRADCERPAEMRMLRNDINWLQRFITECSYQWSSIAPDNYCGYLPKVDFEQISLGGKQIAEKLVKAQFHLSQQKAFKLLEGASLYDNRFVFLREMLQNAVDAIKFQYWNDLDATEFGTNPNVALCEANDELPFRKYPVKIDFAVRKRRKDNPETLLPITVKDIKADNAEHNKYEFGVQVSVQDCGVGIGEEDVVAISRVGTSQAHRQDVVQNMPAWLHPTGKFGIGLQSLFQADLFFKCVTRTHRDECYEMTFHSGTNNEGYINVIPKDWHKGEHGSVPYGTKFTLFVPQTKKESHTTNMSGWAGIDPYDKEYIPSRGLRRSFELMKQMEAQIDSWVGECLFPVVIREEMLDISLRQENWDEKLAPHKELPMKKVFFKKIDAGDFSGTQSADTESLLCWIFTKSIGNPVLRNDLDDKSASYYLDVEHCMLHIWSQKAKCFFACSPKRIVQSITKETRTSDDTPEDRGNKIKIFLKGLLISELVYKEDELIEYIDIKNDRLQDHLYMSRNAFSPEGEAIIRDEIIPLLRETFRDVLIHINQKAISTIEENQNVMTQWILDHFKQINLEEDKNFSQQNLFYIRKRELLEKKLNACNLFDFTLIKNDINWAEDRKNEESPFIRNLDATNSNGCHNLSKCIADELFFDLRNSGNVENYTSRMMTNIKSKVTKLRETKLDIFSHLLDIFSDKMSELNRWLYDDPYRGSYTQMIACAEWIRDFVILCAMFAFYMQQANVPMKSGCVFSGQRQCGWEYVNRRIAYALNHFKSAEKQIPNSQSEYYEEINDLLYVPAVTEKELTNAKDHRCSISELMLQENQFVVFSTRQSQFDPWKHILVRLHPLEDRTSFLHLIEANLGNPNILDFVKCVSPNPNILDILNYSPKNREECAARWAFLDLWNELTIASIKNEWIAPMAFIKEEWRIVLANPNGALNRMTEDIWGNPTTRWLVRKFPSVALGSDSSGNNRLNVLSAQAKPHVFYDARMLKLLIDRINEQYAEHCARRFVTTVWDGLGELACKDVSTYILTVRRGTIPEVSKKEQMLLAFGCDLPEDGVTLSLIPAYGGDEPNSKNKGGTKKVKTFFQLLEAIKQCYKGEGMVPDFGLDQLHRIIKEYQNIQQMQPFHGKHRETDLRIIKLLQAYCAKHSESKPDRNLMVRASRQLEENIQTIYESTTLYDAFKSFERAQVNKQQNKKFTYKDIEVPLDRQKFMCAFFLRLYNISITDIPDELSTGIAKILYGEDCASILNLEPYNDEARLDAVYINIQAALTYCNHWIKQEFRNAFLERICDWYWDNVWKKAYAESFLEYTKAHLITPKSDQELKALYRTQLRRIFCAAIIDIDTAYLK